MNQSNINNSKPILLFESVNLAGTFREWKSPLLSAEFVFVQTFKELASTHKKLLEKENEFEFFNVEMKNKWERLKEKQTDFITGVKDYDEFFIENEKKTSRIICKMESKSKVQEKLLKEINDCECRVQYLSDSEEEIENSVELLAPFNNFLETVIENTNFKSISDLINHYVLINSETNLLGKLRSNLFEYECSNSLVTQSLKSKMVNFHEQKNLIFYSVKEYEEKPDLMEELEIAFNEQTQQNDKILKDVVILRNSCNNIYLRLLKWKRIKSPLLLNFESKCSFIVNCLNELREAVKLAEHSNNKKNTSSQADSSFITNIKLI